MAVITQVSNISKQMIPKVEAYHQRKLSDKFFCVYLDATYIPLRHITFDREAVYIAIGIKPNKSSITALRPMKTLKSGRSCSKA